MHVHLSQEKLTPWAAPRCSARTESPPARAPHGDTQAPPPGRDPAAEGAADGGFSTPLGLGLGGCGGADRVRRHSSHGDMTANTARSLPLPKPRISTANTRHTSLEENVASKQRTPAINIHFLTQKEEFGTPAQRSSRSHPPRTATEGGLTGRVRGRLLWALKKPGSEARCRPGTQGKTLQGPPSAPQTSPFGRRQQKSKKTMKINRLQLISAPSQISK